MGTIRRSSKLSLDELETVQEVQVGVQTWNEVYIDFLHHCQVRGLRGATIDNYRNEIGRCLGYLKQHDVADKPSTVTKNELETSLVIYMQDLGLNPSTINTRIKCMKVFYTWLKSEKIIKTDHMKKVKLLPYRQPPIESFSREDVKAILNSPNKCTWNGVRDYAILLLLIETGIRARELCEIELQDLQLDKGQVLIRKSKTYLQRYVSITKPTIHALKQWLSVRGQSSYINVFITLSGKSLTPRLLGYTTTKYGQSANVKNVRCSPHTFRHTFAKLFLQNGGDIISLQRLLGHTDITMTRRYVHFTQEDLNDVVGKYSPLNDVW